MSVTIATVIRDAAQRGQAADIAKNSHRAETIQKQWAAAADAVLHGTRLPAALGATDQFLTLQRAKQEALQAYNAPAAVAARHVATLRAREAAEAAAQAKADADARAAADRAEKSPELQALTAVAAIWRDHAAT